MWRTYIRCGKLLIMYTAQYALLNFKLHCTLKVGKLSWSNIIDMHLIKLNSHLLVMQERGLAKDSNSHRLSHHIACSSVATSADLWHQYLIFLRRLAAKAHTASQLWMYVFKVTCIAYRSYSVWHFLSASSGCPWASWVTVVWHVKVCRQYVSCSIATNTNSSTFSSFQFYWWLLYYIWF